MARTFNGSTDWVDMGSASASGTLDITGHIAISAWIKPAIVSGAANPLTAFSKGYDGNTAYDLAIDTTGPSVMFTTFPGATHGATWVYSPGSNLIVGQWYHFYGDWDGTNWRLFRNGFNVVTTADTTPPTHTIANFAIGAVHNETTPAFINWFQGSVADVAVWSGGAGPGVLSSANITNLAGTSSGTLGGAGSAQRANAITPLPSGVTLVGYWPMPTTEAGTAVADLAGTHNGTAQHATTPDSDPTQLQGLATTTPMVLATVRRRFLRR